LFNHGGMQLGIISRTFSRPTLAELLDAIQAQGLECVQFNFASLGLPTLPEKIDPGLADEIRAACHARKLSLAAVSGTFNLIHPDLGARQDGLRRLVLLAEVCARLGAPLLTLCTGTRDPENMWRRHPANDEPDAWRDLLESLGRALELTESTGMALGIEPEPGNVVATAPKARRLLDEMASPRLRIVMDGANLFQADNLARMPQVFAEAFDLLGGDIAIAHAKDVQLHGALKYVASGKGILDYGDYLARLRGCGYTGPLILHELQEQEVPGCVQLLRAKLRPTQ